jgi:Fe2+ or Zn2+ uptake regulation protein
LAIRNTKQREALLNSLWRIGSHPTADEIYDEMRKVMSDISKGTVHRNLENTARNRGDHRTKSSVLLQNLKLSTGISRSV